MGIKDIFKGSAKAVVDSVGNALDKVFTNKEELAQAKLEVEKEINRHVEQLETNTLKELELQIQDRTTARQRETDFVKATGHIDFLMWFLALSIIGIFASLVWAVITKKVPPEQENLVFHILGIVEGVLLSVYGYYYGSSAGSRIKDMKK